MNSKKIQWAVLTVLLAGLGAYGWHSHAHRALPLPSYGQVPPFKLLEKGGRTVTEADLGGRVSVVDFIFTNCAGTCPVMTWQMNKLQKKWSGKGVLLVSITVDPKRDTAQALAKYAHANEAREGDWLFLTGPQRQIFKLAVEGFKVTAQDNPEAKPGDEFIHSTRFALVDRKGQIRGLYDGTDDEAVAKLNLDLAQLLKERN